ncbi:glycosyltransferase family 39 protein [bacterium]|nr:glycosyltransferase family 39 protein [bacterium]
MSDHPSPITHHPSFITILIFGVFLRLYKLGSKSLWLDEACSVYLAKLPLFKMLSQIIKSDAHPPFYNLLLYFWVTLGSTEWYVRLLSALFSIITIWIVYLIGKNLFSQKAGIIASLITSVSSYQIYYAQETRLYALITLLCMLSLLILVSALRTSNIKMWILFTVVNIIALYTYVYSAFFIIGEYIVAVWFLKSAKNSMKIILSTALITCLAFIPEILVLFSRKADIATLLKPFELSSIIIMLPQFVFGYFLLQSGLTAILTFILFTIIIAMGVFYDRHNKNIYLLILLIVIPIIITILSPFRTTQFQSKHLIFLSPIVYLLIAHAITKFPKKSISILAVIFIALLNLASLRIYYSRDFAKENWRSAALFISKNSMQDDIICYDPPYAGFAFDYYDKTGLKRHGIKRNALPETLSRIINLKRRIWLIQNSSYVSVPNPEIRRIFDKNLKTKISKQYKGFAGNIDLMLYEK